LKYISLHSVPRSGSTWLGSILDSSYNTCYRFQPLFSYTHKGYLNPESKIEDINRFFEDIYKTKDEFVLQKKPKQNGLIPEFKKKELTHIVYKEVRYHHILRNILNQSENIKVIGLIRNPLAVISSWLNAPKEFRKDLGWSIEDEWLNAPSKNLNKPEEFYGYNKWKDVCYSFMDLKKDYPKCFHLINYDDLVENTEKTVKQLFEFCDLEYSDQTDRFLNITISNNSKNVNTYSVYKNKSDDNAWERVLPIFIKEEIKKDSDFVQLNKIFKWI